MTLQNTRYRHNDYDRAYANGDFIANAKSYPAKWAEQAAAFRAEQGERALLDLSYGTKARNRYDLFLPASEPKGTLVFIHGGYWQAFSKESFSHMAAGAVASGWACAVPSYTLSPEASIAEITAEIAAMVVDLAARVEGKIVITGHSAGGHLAARMAGLQSPLPAAVADRVVKVVPISPLADLQPLLATKMNLVLGMNEAESIAESPANDVLAAHCGCHVWVGAEERPSFLWQARLLSEQWESPWTSAAGKHHFTVIDDLTDPDSELTKACLE